MSRCASLMTVHHALRARPALLDRLYQPFLWNRQAEHAADDVTYSRAPIYWRAGERVCARYYDDYVRKGYALAGEPLDQPGADALEAMQGAGRGGGQLDRVPARSGASSCTSTTGSSRTAGPRSATTAPRAT